MSGGKRLSARRDLITFTFFAFLIALASAPASAQFYVRSPEVDKGEAEIEEHGALYSGASEDERLRHSHEIEGKYGIRERFEAILEGEVEQPIGEDLEGKAIELGGQYEFIERHGDGLGFAFRTLYEFALPDDLTKFCSGRWRDSLEAMTLRRSTPSLLAKSVIMSR